LQHLYLIRHAKSSWADPGLDDFHRPLNQRGEKAVVLMGQRLAEIGIVPQLIVASPAARTRATANALAHALGYDGRAIRYDDGLYLGSEAYHYRLFETLFTTVDSILLVGHNNTISYVAAHLSGRDLGIVPTCGIVALEYDGQGFAPPPRQGRLRFFWYPKDGGNTAIAVC
jgi:phosphohistidine phosphatase